MNCSYKKITHLVAKKIKLIMTDVDDTLTSNDGSFSPSVKEAISLLKNQGIVVGLISGRNMPNLETCAAKLGITGPLIAENGGLVKLNPEGKRQMIGNQKNASTALSRLKKQFGDDINAGDWNQKRMTDLILNCKHVPLGELKKHVDDVDVIETSYFYGNSYNIHLSRKGINKGNVLKMLLSRMDHGEINSDSTMVIGDGLNDLSMFRLFHHGILIHNSNQPEEHRKTLLNSACYAASSPGGEGFAEVVNHIIDMRQNSSPVQSVL